MSLQALGWTHDFDSEWASLSNADDHQPARVLSSNRQIARLQTSTHSLWGLIPPKGSSLDTYPVAGDWCRIPQFTSPPESTRIHSLLTRKNQLRRKQSGQAVAAQVLASNVDLVLILTSKGHDFSWNRLDRYLAMAKTDGITALICLTKADLDKESTATEASVRNALPNVPVITLSVATGEGIDRLTPLMPQGRTSILLGSSGVGKSTLTNHLLGYAERSTQPVREGDDKGRHTTSNSEMIRTESFGWIVDAPGLRELEPWDAQEGITANFQEIPYLAQSCRFRNCAHDQESGCAVRQALEAGLLSERTWNNYARLMREQQRQTEQSNERARTEKKRFDKRQSQLHRRITRHKQSRAGA